MTAYEMRIIDWISYVCSSYLLLGPRAAGLIEMTGQIYVWQSNAPNATEDLARRIREGFGVETRALSAEDIRALDENLAPMFSRGLFFPENGHRSEEHTSELQSLMRISSAVFCLKKKKTTTTLTKL